MIDTVVWGPNGPEVPGSPSARFRPVP
jgi:hypothetical protein